MADYVQPADIPLPLPLPGPVLGVILVALFILHLVVVNVMLGGSILAVVFECIGLKRRNFDRLAHEIAKTITVTKSMAVVLGVGPLLAINLLYTIPFYTANRLTGNVWILIIPLVTIAFLLTYLHKYTWESLARHKAIHIAIGVTSTLILLAIPLIFLMNINLMQYPDRWREVQEGGVWAALTMANVLPRYVHFVLASLTGTSLFLLWWFTRPARNLEALFPDETRGGLRRLFLRIALITTGLQFLAGPVVLLTLPTVGLSGIMLAHLAAGVVLAAVVLRWLWLDLHEVDNQPDLPVRFWRIVFGLGVVVVFMATARQLYRHTALDAFQKQSRIVAQERQKKVAYYQEHPPAAAPKDPLEDLPGYSTFKANCTACHGVRDKLVGPSAITMGTLYATPDGADAFTSWMRTTTGPRRPHAPDEPPMKMPAYGPGQLDAAAVSSLHSFVTKVAELEAAKKP